MPTFYNFKENGLNYSFDDIFVPADLFRDGNLFTWGNNSFGQLGEATLTLTSTPVTTFAGGNNWKQVSCGSQHTAAIKTDGTLWSWGEQNNGKLGNRIVVASMSTAVTTFAGGTNWKQVDIGYVHTAAVKTDGTLWGWGNSSFGRLGNASITLTTSTPVTTFAGGTNWKQVDGGDDHTAAIKTDGTLWIWGSVSGGKLGDGVTSGAQIGLLNNFISTPVTTFAGGTNWKQVSAGNLHTAAIKTDGTLWVWGVNTFGQLGNATIVDVSTPITTFAGGNNWKQVSCENNQTAAIKTDGTLWLWGIAQNGRLGNAITSAGVNVSTPITTFAGGTNWKQVGCGFNHTAAIKADGTLWVWGNNNDRKLGINSTLLNISTPVTTFAGGTNWKQGVVQNDHMAALTYDDPVI